MQVLVFMLASFAVRVASCLGGFMKFSSSLQSKHVFADTGMASKYVPM